MAASLVLTGCASGDGDSAPKADGAKPAPSASATPRPLTFGERAVRRLSLREAAGQVIVAQYAGTASPAPLVRRLHLGGVIAFSDNVSSTDQIRRVNRSVGRVVAARGWPAFLGVDQEGGIVDRVGAPSTDFPAFMAAGAAGVADTTERAARASAAEMRGLGFDVVLAPDADVTVGDGDAAIGSRSAGGRPRQAATQVVAAMRGIEGAGVLPVLKHFPGHGSLGTDSHAGLPVQGKSAKALRRSDLVPFTAAIAARAPAVLTGHIALTSVDPGVPTSISRKVTTGLLRDQLGFHGLVVTDALDMGGVQQRAPGARAAVRALRAGADVLLMPPDPRAARDAIVRAVREGGLSRARLDEAAARMIDTLRAVHAGRGARPGSGRPAALALARESVTSVAGPCTGRLVPGRVRVVGDPGDVAAFDARMSARGVTIAHDTTRRVRHGSRLVVVGHERRLVKVRKRVHGVVRVVKVRKRVAVRKRRPVFRNVRVLADAPTVALVAYGGKVPGPVRGPADITVALDRPSVLGRVGSRVELATYGDEPVALDALADVLMGTRRATGHLPLAVPGVSRSGC